LFHIKTLTLSFINFSEKILRFQINFPNFVFIFNLGVNCCKGVTLLHGEIGLCNI